MTYVLVSLVGDEATRDADALSKRLEDVLQPLSVHRGEEPDIEAVRRSMSDTETAVLFGHDGSGTLRASRDAEHVWVDGRRLGEVFTGSRIYLFACSPFDPEGDSLAERAVQHGARVVVGHDAWIFAIDPACGYSPTQLEVLQDAALAMIVAFIKGESSQSRLQEVGLRAYDVLEIDDLFALKPDGSPLFNAAIILQKLPATIRVWTAERTAD